LRRYIVEYVLIGGENNGMLQDLKFGRFAKPAREACEDIRSPQRKLWKTIQQGQ